MIISIIIVTAILLLLTLFIVSILFIYQKKQISYQKNLNEIVSDFEKTLLSTQLEIQEHTFQNISREIHDNISLSLTLAKLNMNTLNLSNIEKSKEQLDSSIELVSKAINDLSDISRSLNSEIISEKGLIKALESEIGKLIKLELFTIQFEIKGNPVFMNSQKELVIFRIVQESLNNILRHSSAKKVVLQLDYTKTSMDIHLFDDGIGFVQSKNGLSRPNNYTSGIRNMKKRSELINGTFTIDSILGAGTTIKLSVPLHENQ